MFNTMNIQYTKNWFLENNFKLNNILHGDNTTSKYHLELLSLQDAQFLESALLHVFQLMNRNNQHVHMLNTF